MKLNAKITVYDLQCFIDNYEIIIRNISESDNYKNDYLPFYKDYLVSVLFNFFQEYETIELNSQLLCFFGDKVLTFINSKLDKLIENKELENENNNSN